jgi:hypothetical protein
MLWDAQHLCHLNTLIDTIRWLVRCTGWYVNIWGYRLLTPERVINVNSTTIMLDALVIKYQTILANKLDTLLHDKKEKTCLPINRAIPDFQTFTQKKPKNSATTKTWRSQSAGCGK